MDIVSNSRITEEEYRRWKEGRKGVRASTLTASECKARRARMDKIVTGHKVSLAETRPSFSCIPRGSMNRRHPRM